MTIFYPDLIRGKATSARKFMLDRQLLQLWRTVKSERNLFNQKDSNNKYGEQHKQNIFIGEIGGME
jgi:hypothetical protein